MWKTKTINCAKNLPAKPPMNKIKIGRLTLSSPIICASGTFGFGEELRELADFKSIGALTTKTITLQPRPGNPPPRIYETEYGVINSVGLENPGLEGFLKEKLPGLKRLSVPFIVSLGGFSLGEYENLVKRLDAQAAVKALEINLSCPNLQLKKIISQDPALTYKLTKSLRRLTTKTLIVKITPETDDITEIARAVEAGGADSVSLVNTFYAMAINIETRKPYLGAGYGGYSGKAIKPMALYRVFKTAQAVKIPIIGGGGIETAGDAIEFLIAGAAAVSIGTLNMSDPAGSRAILAGIKQYLKKNRLTGVDQLKTIC